MSDTRGTLLVKVGGSIQDNPDRMRAIAGEIADLCRRGYAVAVVHGGGKAISAAMNQAGLEARFVLGQRYTDLETLAIAERVLGGEVNTQLVRDIAQQGPFAMPVSTLTRCVLYARRSGAADSEGTEHDLGFVGRVIEVDAAALQTVVNAGIVPVIAPVALDLDKPGQRLNVNADLAAGEIARRWGAVSTFVLVSDTAGVRTDSKTYARSLTGAQCAHLRVSGVIDGGMIPKIDACLMALSTRADRRVRITDGRQQGGLLAAVVSDEFPGTAIVP